MAAQTHPWLRQAGESAQAFLAFCTYRDLGTDRSIDAAYAKATKRQRSGKNAPGQWTKWSGEHGWVERAQAFDDHNAAITEQARQKALAKEAEKWERRRAEVRERDYTLGERLQKKARELLTQPLETRASDVPRMAETGSKLARLAAGLETDHQKVSGSISVDIDLSDKSDEELRTYLAGLVRAGAVLAGIAEPGLAAPGGEPRAGAAGWDA